MNAKLSLQTLILSWTVLLISCNDTNKHALIYPAVIPQIEQSNRLIKHEMRSIFEETKHDLKRYPDYQILVETSKKVLESGEKFEKYIQEVTNNLRNDLVENEPIIKGFMSEKYENKTLSKSSLTDLNNQLKRTRYTIVDALENMNDEGLLGSSANEEITHVKKKILFTDVDTLTFQNDVWNKYDLTGKTNNEIEFCLLMIENEVLTSVFQIQQYLRYKVSICSHVVFDKYVVISSPRKMYIKPGETFKADIFLSAASSQSEFTAKINGKTYPVEDGVILYETKPEKYGTHTYEAEITIKNPHTEKEATYKKTFKYEVGECYN